jgi:hypothetical protein
MEHWSNGTDRGKQKYMKKNLTYFLFLHHKSHTDCSGVELGPPQRKAAK